MTNQEPVNKCDTCQNQFSCTSEDGQCEEGKETYEVLSYDEITLETEVEGV